MVKKVSGEAIRGWLRSIKQQLSRWACDGRRDPSLCLRLNACEIGCASPT